MKLRKQAPAKAAIVGAAGALFLVALALIRADPRVRAEPEPPPDIDYRHFFTPAGQPSEPAPPAPALQRHTRTRAS